MLFENDSSYGALGEMCANTSRRLGANARGTCPVDMTRALVGVAHAQSCGKCTPCRVGLGAMTDMLEQIIGGTAEAGTIERLEDLAEQIRVSSDCAVGYQAAEQVLMSIKAFRDDFEYHAETGGCLRSSSQGVPCVVSCPAHVDIPGYIALTAAGRYEEAVELIRKDNPFPSACAYVCEHPCEETCRRTMVDDAVNIRGIKRYAVDHAAAPRPCDRGPATGKRVAIVGAGPSGLTCGYFLARMGHEVVAFEQREKAGGMLRYGIPNYRLPKTILDDEIASIEAAGVEIRCGVTVGTDVTLEELQRDFDVVYIAMGAHGDKKLRMPGEDAEGVVPAVKMLREIGLGHAPDYTGLDVCVVGGGNVAMDAARSAVRCGAKSVTVVYRRRTADMTALPEEIEGTIADGCEIADLMAPLEILTDEQGHVCALKAQPQIIGPVKRGRPAPIEAEREPHEYPCQVVIVAIGQDIQSDYFAEKGLPTSWKQFDVDESLAVPEHPGIFSGGDCMRGPATVILAIADGKKAARSIDTYLGFHHAVSVDITLPTPRLDDRVPCGRSVLGERAAEERVRDFDLVEYGLSEQEIRQETLRCLNCDHFGCGILHEEGRMSW
ncbi:NAD(P)-binding protein [Enorma phocaeensis]|uniref:FAD-dependent oxidoreductase n=1 Tax=Enorma phocaeensis TaxID=1871019 RepID=A0A921LU86_9ACTN|nr:NAD(P)-binding protein [Enorma phocaeensis]HJG36485.1 FAD-dependent oxidoreductase [Enorma phocaeensis]